MTEPWPWERVCQGKACWHSCDEVQAQRSQPRCHRTGLAHVSHISKITHCLLFNLPHFSRHFSFLECSLGIPSCNPHDFSGYISFGDDACWVLSHFSRVWLSATQWNCSPPGSSVHGDSPGKNTGVGCHAFLRGSSQTRDLTLIFYVSCIGRQVLYHLGNHTLGKVVYSQIKQV